MSKSAKTIRRENYKQALAKQVETNPNAREVAKRYKLMIYLLDKEWGNTLIKMGQADLIEKFLQDVVYVDRAIRKATEGSDILQKKILSQEKQIDLGYEVDPLKSSFLVALEKE